MPGVFCNSPDASISAGSRSSAAMARDAFSKANDLKRFDSLSSTYCAISSSTRATSNLFIRYHPVMQSRDRLIVALDRSSRDDILALVDGLRGVAGAFKIGLQAFIDNGPALVREVVAGGEKVFLDLK